MLIEPGRPDQDGRDLGTGRDGHDALTSPARTSQPAAGPAKVVDEPEPEDERPDRFRLAEWRSLPDECFIQACGADSGIDQRGPVWLRGGVMRKACTEHWEGVMRVLGEQATWEQTDGYASPAEQDGQR